MPRQLPWKVGAAAEANTSRPKSGTASPPSPLSSRPTPTPKPESTTASKAKKPRRSLLDTATRSPSTSPPPEPLQEEFMIEGIEHDDRYRMVEDEFLAVAGDFTRHLHAAEYQRLKSLVNDANADAIRSISRPVTGEMTDLVRRRHAALDTASKQRRGIAKVLLRGNEGRAERGRSTESDDDVDLPVNRRPPTLLQGLMDSPRKQAVPLTSVMARSSTVRAAARDNSPTRRCRDLFDDGDRTATSEQKDWPSAGIKRERVSDTDDDEDDLDGQPSWPKLDLERRKKSSTFPDQQASTPQPPRWSQTDPTTASHSARKAESPPRQSNTPSHYQNDDAKMDDEDDDLFAQIKARRAEQKRRRESGRVHATNVKIEAQAVELNSIPFI